MSYRHACINNNKKNNLSEDSHVTHGCVVHCSFVDHNCACTSLAVKTSPIGRLFPRHCTSYPLNSYALEKEKIYLYPYICKLKQQKIVYEHKLMNCAVLLQNYF